MVEPLDRDRDRPSSSSSAARPRHTVHISSIRPAASPFPAQRNPLLPPPPRKRELPFSSQDRYSSPEKAGAAYHAGLADAGQAGPSCPRVLSPPPPPPPVNMSDDEDEFDGIEDALPTQADPRDNTSPFRRKALGLASLDDLFADDEFESTPATSGFSSGADHAESSKRAAPSSGRQDITDLSSSPPVFPPLASSSRRPTHAHSDTPPSPFPKTPHLDDEDVEIEWSPSPVTQRTRKQRAPSESPPAPLARQTQSSKARSKGKATMLADDTAMDMDEGYDDMPFPDDFDFDSLEEPSGSGSSAPPLPPLQRNADAGRAFRPSSMSTSKTTSKPQQSSPSSRESRESRVVSALDELNDPHRLLLIPDLSPAEQDFYRNHWRRGADKGSSKRSTAREEEEFSDGEFAGPQPPAKKKTTSYKRGGGGGFRRGFRGRGRGRGRARGGKR